MKPDVRVHHTDHSDAGEIQPLGDHLRANKDIRPAIRELPEDWLMSRAQRLHAIPDQTRPGNRLASTAQRSVPNTDGPMVLLAVDSASGSATVAAQVSKRSARPRWYVITSLQRRHACVPVTPHLHPPARPAAIHKQDRLHASS